MCVKCKIKQDNQILGQSMSSCKTSTKSEKLDNWYLKKTTNSTPMHKLSLAIIYSNPINHKIDFPMINSNFFTTSCCNLDNQSQIKPLFTKLLWTTRMFSHLTVNYEKSHSHLLDYIQMLASWLKFKVSDQLTFPSFMESIVQFLQLMD